jgi:hypothetical protein
MKQLKRLFARRWIPGRLYHSLPWAAVVAGALGMAAQVGVVVFVMGCITLSYGSFVLGVRLAWHGCGEV